jgi:hypothetical protein
MTSAAGQLTGLLVVTERNMAWWVDIITYFLKLFYNKFWEELIAYFYLV